MENNLQESWCEVSLGEIAEINYGKDFRKSNFADREGYPLYSANGIIGYSKEYNRENETVVLGCRGSVGFVHLTPPKSYITHNCFSIEPYDLIPKKFVYYLLKGINMSDVITGTAVPQITITNLSPLLIPLPPLAEQHRIVAKLDAVMQKVENNKQRLEKIPKLLKRFRQSVLAAAVSGELSEDWREKNGIIEEWEDVSLGSIANMITSGSRGWAKYYSKSGSIFVRAQNINRDVLDLSDIAFVTLPNTTEGIRTLIKEKDILVTITGANVTKTAYVNFKIENAYVSQHVGLVRLKNKIISKFIYLFLISESYGRKQLLASAYGQGKPQLNLDNLKVVEISLPPLEEQKEIVRRVEQLFAFADKIESRYTKAKVMLDKLPQSILAKAFRGELVPQNPNDEPASVLLARIKAEKEKLAKEKKKKKD